jgi:hypothetical protein
MPWRSTGAIGHNTRLDSTVFDSKVTPYDERANSRRCSVVVATFRIVADSASRHAILPSREVSSNAAGNGFNTYAAF